MSDNAVPTLLDAIFVAGITYLGARLLFKTVGLSANLGGVIAIGAVAVTSFGIGPDKLQNVAGYVLLPANTLRNTLADIEFNPAQLEGNFNEFEENPAN